MESIYGWIGFLVFVILMLALDLGVFNRKTHAISIKEALIWSAVWISLALAFNALIYYNLGEEKALQFLTGYVIEKALSVDNLFVFIMVFGYFHVPLQYQHKILFWGIIGALLMRGFFIATGVALIQNFSWVMYVFGAFLVYTGLQMLFAKEKEKNPENNFVVKLFKRFFKVTDRNEGSSFFVKRDGVWMATPLFIVLIVIEVTDLVFAVDSIPAILAITDDPYIVFTSNVFAILGLRSLYFALAGLMQYFTYLKYGLSLILVFVGVKMVIGHYFAHLAEPKEFVSVGASLLIIVGILTVSILASLAFSPKKELTK